jgi:phosphoribosylaminoimidazole-succinocarboxamide synthase
MKDLTHRVNAVLRPLFANAGIDLVDYKLEFGHPVDDSGGSLVLGDEFTPDGCRLWDAKTGEKLDKDRFRRDLGSVNRALSRSRDAHRRAALTPVYFFALPRGLDRFGGGIFRLFDVLCCRFLHRFG